MKNLFLQAVTTIDIDIFGDLRPAESQTSNCRQFLKFFQDTPTFFLWNFHM